MAQTPSVASKKSDSQALSPVIFSPEAWACILCLAALLGGWLARDSGATTTWTVSNLLFLVSYLAGGWFATVSALRSLVHWDIEIDLLMILAALGAAYVGAPLEGSVLLFLFSFSNVLQSYAIERSRNAVRALMDLRPRTAMVRRGTKLVEIAAQDLVAGDQVVIRPGERIPADGKLIEGHGSVDQSSMTGESLPVERDPGDTVFDGTLNQAGGFEMVVTASPTESLLARMVALVEDAQANKARAQRFLETAEKRYAVGVILFTILVATVPLIWGTPLDKALYKAMTVMVVMSPCALVISIPATILSAIGGAARQGILFKGGGHLERAATLEIVAFDKTGTLTSGKPSVQQINAWNVSSDMEMLRLAAAVSMRSEHPLARSIVQRARDENLVIPDVSDFRSFTGNGTEAIVEGRRITVGNMRKLVGDGGCGDVIAHAADIDRAADLGQTPVGVAERQADGTVRVLGMITLSDTARPDAAETVQRLKAIGIKRVVMITGDNSRVARAVASKLGIEEFYAELLPEDKVKVIRTLQQQAPTAMVGDGVNDAPSLAAATVGIAMGSGGTDLALETADMILMGNRLSHIPRAIALSRRARTIVMQNLVFAGVVILLLTLAALEGNIPLSLGVAGHEGSTVLVCLNGMRMLMSGKSA